MHSSNINEWRLIPFAKDYRINVFGDCQVNIGSEWVDNEQVKKKRGIVRIDGVLYRVSKLVRMVFGRKILSRETLTPKERKRFENGKE